MDCEDAPESLVLLPLVRACALLAPRDIALTMLVPPYAALGSGELRVLRASEQGEQIRLVAGYERYDRLEVG